MKQWKKVLAVMLTVAVVLAMGLSAFAEGEDPYATTVTVNNVKQGNVLKLYKIADAAVGADNVIAYTMASGLPAAYDTVDEIAAVTTDAGKKAMADAFAAAFYGTSPAYSATAGSGDSATVDPVAPGYYFAIVSGNADAGIIYQSMLINAVMQVDGNSYKPHTAISATVKSEEITLTKTEKDGNDQVHETDSYNLGETIPFTITTQIPNYPSNAKHATFEITDTPTGVVDDTQTIKVTVDGSEVTVGDDTYSVLPATGGFTVEFKEAFVLAHAGKEVVVTYNGTLAGPVDEDGQTSNTASVTYNPNPFENTEDDIEDTDTQQIYGLVFEKTNENGAAIDNATFALLDADGNAVKNPDGTDMTFTTSTADGHTYVWFEGLSAGTYTLKETKAPAGYTTVANFDMTVGETVSTNDNPATADTEETYYTVMSNKVANEKGPELPETGGIGTKIFYIVGGILVLGACVLLAARRKRS